jgi:hypothetical protein
VLDTPDEAAWAGIRSRFGLNLHSEDFKSFRTDCLSDAQALIDERGFFNDMQAMFVIALSA